MRGNKVADRAFVSLSEPYSLTPAAQASVVVKYEYSITGQLMARIEYFAEGTIYTVHNMAGEEHPADVSGMLASAVKYGYDADGRILSQVSFGRSLNGSGYGERAEGEGLALISQVDYGAFGYDAAGRLRGYSYYAARHEVDTGVQSSDPIGFAHRYVYQYEGRESYLEKQVYGSSSNSNFRASSTTSTYDAWGRRTAVREQTPLPSNLGTLDDRIRYFSYDGEGNILRRIEGTLVNGGNFNQDGSQYDQTQVYAYVGGQQVASGKYTGEVDVIGRLTAYDSSELGSVTAAGCTARLDDGVWYRSRRSLQ